MKMNKLLKLIKMKEENILSCIEYVKFLLFNIVILIEYTL